MADLIALERCVQAGAHRTRPLLFEVTAKHPRPASRRCTRLCQQALIALTLMEGAQRGQRQCCHCGRDDRVIGDFRTVQRDRGRAANRFRQRWRADRRYGKSGCRKLCRRRYGVSWRRLCRGHGRFVWLRWNRGWCRFGRRFRQRCRYGPRNRFAWGWRFGQRRCDHRRAQKPAVFAACHGAALEQVIVIGPHGQ
ncbi:hypothetical protein ALP64_204184 [Pseudomonas syringae pv. actinidiae]|nr:hypothetical protein ALP64_204184 [Pseudomonas syringae pv. actinidiae]